MCFWFLNLTEIHRNKEKTSSATKVWCFLWWKHDYPLQRSFFFPLSWVLLNKPSTPQVCSPSDSWILTFERKGRLNSVRIIWILIQPTFLSGLYKNLCRFPQCCSSSSLFSPQPRETQVFTCNYLCRCQIIFLENLLWLPLLLLVVRVGLNPKHGQQISGKDSLKEQMSSVLIQMDCCLWRNISFHVLIHLNMVRLFCVVPCWELKELTADGSCCMMCKH